MYRETMRTCPGCSSPMQPVRVVLGVAEVTVLDVCGACGGVFFDYFAGEPAQLARKLLGKNPNTDAVLVTMVREPACPSCSDELALATYLDDGPLLYRCDGCLAAFVTARQLQLLAEFEHHRKASAAVLRAVGERLGVI